jgi:hypothetical protein
MESKFTNVPIPLIELTSPRSNVLASQVLYGGTPTVLALSGSKHTTSQDEAVIAKARLHGQDKRLARDPVENSLGQADLLALRPVQRCPSFL